MNNIKGNLTTIIKLTVMFIAPYIGVAEATQNNLISLITAIIFLIIGYYDARYDSTIIRTVNLDTVIEDEGLPQDIEKAVQETCREVDEDGA